MQTDFVIYNNYKNYIINNKSDKNQILNLRMTARHCRLSKNRFFNHYKYACRKISARLVFVGDKHATGNDAF
jgi:hypothetical protein